MRISVNHASLPPFALSLSKGFSSFFQKPKGFDRLSPNGFEVRA
jgi:hypothetical protein